MNYTGNAQKKCRRFLRIQNDRVIDRFERDDDPIILPMQSSTDNSIKLPKKKSSRTFPRDRSEIICKTIELSFPFTV